MALFNVIHTESIRLLPTRAKNVPNLAVMWHGIAYETIYSDIIEELLRKKEAQPASMMNERTSKRLSFFQDILNGVGEEFFKPEPSLGNDFKQKFGISKSMPLVLGVAGRLVKDKGQPLVFEGLKQIFMENNKFQQSVTGDGPSWGTWSQYIPPLQLAKFYNATDIFVNQTLLEEMLTGKPVMAIRVASSMVLWLLGKEQGWAEADIKNFVLHQKRWREIFRSGDITYGLIVEDKT
ncbi:hypothetical protein GQ457_12G028350 [Hibiscus cannabinus]